MTGDTVNGNEISWSFTDVAPRETVNLSFQVKIPDPGVVIENQAKIFDGTNKLTNSAAAANKYKMLEKH